MRTIITSVLCSSVLALAGCAKDTTSVSQATSATKKTVLASGIEKANMDLSVRPQDNFYRYVNGKWITETEIPGDKTSIGAFYDLRDKAAEDVKAIIETLANAQDLENGSDEQKVADLFRSYMDTKGRDGAGVAPIRNILNEIAGLNDKDQLAEAFGRLQAIDLSIPLGFYVEVDAKQSSRYAMHIWQYGLALPDRDYYLKDDERSQKLRAGYLAHIERMFDLAGLNNGKQAAQTVMDLETRLAQFHNTRVENRDEEKLYNKFEVAKLGELTEDFNWQAYFGATGVAGQKDIIINQPDYIRGFGKVFKETSLDDWKTYLTFHTLHTYADYLSQALEQESFDFFSRQLNGRQEQQPLWKRGVEVVNEHLGEVTGKLYVERHFKPEAKARMSELVENLRSAYGESIDELDWMSEDTKKAARVKLAAFTPKIGYPDRWEDYSALEIEAGDLVGNIMRSVQLNLRKQVDKLDDPIHKWEWGMTPQTVNAYYNPTVNEIVFPAAFLQPPFFNMAAEDAVNYGGIGAVIGHEMGHGFDDQGSLYDADGNLRNWWKETDLIEFKKRTRALVQQYNGYHVFEDLTVNGELTLGENIGDLSGVAIAYKAYKNSLHGLEAPVIDGLTGDQRFFMGYAQIWRAKIVEESMRNRVATDPHSPSEFRALGSLSNMDAFYKAFALKPGDKMYKAEDERVKIW